MKNEKQTEEQLFKEPAKSENKKKKSIQPLSENFYKIIFENTKIAIAILGEDNTILLANREFERLAGYTREEMEGKKKWMEFIYRKDELEQMKEYRRLRLIDPLSVPQEYEFQFLDRKGQIKDILTTIATIPGTKQTLTTLLDITDGKRVEAALQESERRLADIIDFLPDPTFAIDFSGKVIAWNHAMEEMTGVKTEDMVGKGNHEYEILLRGTNKPLLIEQAMGIAVVDEKNYDFVKREGDVLIAEAEITLRGKSLALWGKAAPLRDSNGKTIGAIQSFHDITELKQAKVALQESEKQVRHKLDAILSPEGDIDTLELSDIIDTEKIQKLMDEFYRLTHIGIGIIDLKGRVLVGTGWQDICTNFHRFNPESCRLCMESDLELTSNVPVGTFKKYQCKNNMWDIATPIMLGNKQVGNIFLGQFLFDDEVPDLNTFREQARRFGFNEQEYIEALDRVPRWSRETVNTAMTFYAALAELIGNLSYSNIKLASALEERKLAEEALRASEERFNLSMEATNDGLWDWNIKTDAVYFSPGYYRMLDYEADAFPAKVSAWKELIHPDDLEHAVQANMDCIEGRNEHFEVEYRMKARNGEWRWILGRGKCVARDERGYALRLVGTHVDITERKRAEKTLRESETKYRRLHESMTEAFARADMNGRILETNRAFQTMLGYSEEELRQLTYMDFTPEKWHDFERSVIEEQVLIHGHSNVYEKEYRRKDGIIFPVELRVFLLPEDVDKNLSMWAIVRDITERKRAEKILKKQRQQLEDANKELESFSYSISHDLRAPLRAIDGFSRIILKKQGANFDEDTRNKFNLIRHNSETMGQLIDGLLELSRLGRKALAMSTIDMDNLIREVWEEIKVINPDRKMSLAIKPSPPAYGDRQLIRLVYSNLLSNAVKFTKNRDVALIETGGFNDDAKRNVYYVKDNGAGFDMVYYNKLFRVFQRLHRAEEFEGTGIGLATIQRIINRHGGRVWAEGQIDKGATFYFSLPASTRK